MRISKRVNLRMPDVVRHSTSDDLVGLKILADTLLDSANTDVRQDIFEEGGSRIFRLSKDGSEWQEIPGGPVNA